MSIFQRIVWKKFAQLTFNALPICERLMRLLPALGYATNGSSNAATFVISLGHWSSQLLIHLMALQSRIHHAPASPTSFAILPIPTIPALLLPQA
jgi:hypothetical protein